MDRLAMFGGPMLLSGMPLQRYNSITSDEVSITRQAIKHQPLSGFLGGVERGGHYIQRLEELWSHKFKIKHAVACNSATSGLLAACAAAGCGPLTSVVTTPFTMSATAAAPQILGANIIFGEIEDETYSLAEVPSFNDRNKKLAAIIVTNLFGHPAHLARWKRKALELECWLIEDNAQSILATEDGIYAGTIGDIGVFSLNVHKHIQVGEGGVICTNDNGLAKKLRGFVNHGELKGGSCGLNLRMTEYTAAMAISQLMRGDGLVASRVTQAQSLIAAASPFKWLKGPVTRANCTHSFYVVPFQYQRLAGFPHRNNVVKAIAAEGLPLVAGYGPPINRLNCFQNSVGKSTVADRLHDENLLYFSNCEWSLDASHTHHLVNVFDKIERAIAKGDFQKCSTENW